MSDNEQVTKKAKDFDKTEFNILWEGKPSGLFQRFLTKIHMNFTTYQITEDELIIIKGFFSRKTNTIELYKLKDPDLIENIYQRIIGVSTVIVKVDKDANDEGPHKFIILKNIKDGKKVRKLLRDAIEDDVMERKITYFDKV